MGSETRYDASESDSEMVHVPVRSNEHNDAKDNKDQHHYNESNAAAKVFAITELLEQVLLQVDHRALRTTLSRVSQSFHQTILGSTRLQRNLYYAPDWNHPNLSPAPIPKSMLDFTTAAYRGRTSNDPAIDNDRPTFQHIFNVRFDRSAIAWVCDPSSSTNGPFRNMLICQPPVVAMKVFCWSSDTRDYRVQLRQKHLENATGVTCGQMWDLVQASESIGGNVQVSWCFDSRSSEGSIRCG